MSLTVTNPVLGTGLADSTKIDQNFADVVSKFGAIDNSDISASAAIDISKLSANNFELIFPLSFSGTPTASGTVPIAVCGVPQDDTTSSYLTTAYDFVCMVPPSAGVNTFKVEYGSWAVGNWVSAATVLGATTVTNTTVTPVSNTVAVTLPNSGVVATSRFVALFVTAVGTWTGGAMNFTLKCKRTTGLRT
jgi:hypothetical protein